MKSNKVYILVDQWTEPFGYDEQFFVFSNLKKAKEKMKERRENFLSHEDEDYIETDKELEKYWKYEDNVCYNMFIVEKTIDKE